MAKIPQQDGLSFPEADAKGIEEEGIFDIVKPFKRALFEQIKQSVPNEEAGQLIEEAGELLIPDSPTGFNIGKMSPKLKAIVQKVKFPAASEGAKVFKKAQPATKEAFQALPTDIQTLKRKEAIEALTKKGPPAPATQPLVKPYEFKRE